MKEFWVNQDALHQMRDLELEKYHQAVQQRMGELAIINSQIQAVWDWRYPRDEN